MRKIKKFLIFKNGQWINLYDVPPLDIAGDKDVTLDGQLFINAIPTHSKHVIRLGDLGKGLEFVDSSINSTGATGTYEEKTFSTCGAPNHTPNIVGKTVKVSKGLDINIDNNSNYNTSKRALVLGKWCYNDGTSLDTTEVGEGAKDAIVFGGQNYNGYRGARTLLGGNINTNEASNSIVSGLKNYNAETGPQSILIGYLCENHASENAVFGIDNIVYSSNSLVAGAHNALNKVPENIENPENKEILTVSNNFALGSNNRLISTSSAAIGTGNIIIHSFSGDGWAYTIGSNNTVNNVNHVVLLGSKLTAGGLGQTIVGTNNKPEWDAVFQVGYGNMFIDDDQKTALEVSRNGTVRVFNVDSSDENSVATVKYLRDFLEGKSDFSITDCKNVTESIYGVPLNDIFDTTVAQYSRLIANEAKYATYAGYATVGDSITIAEHIEQLQQKDEENRQYFLEGISHMSQDLGAASTSAQQALIASDTNSEKIRKLASACNLEWSDSADTWVPQ